VARRAAVLLAIGSAAALAGCAALSGPGACAPGETGRQVAEMVFGRNIGDRLGVSEDDFARFLDEEVTPRFPDGLTVLDSQGRWLSQGRLVREPGKLVILVLPGRPGDRSRLAEIARAYEARFRQQAVLTMTRPACTGFWPAAG
jgi:hypothetical protein